MLRSLRATSQAWKKKVPLTRQTGVLYKVQKDDSKNEPTHHPERPMQEVGPHVGNPCSKDPLESSKSYVPTYTKQSNTSQTTSQQWVKLVGSHYFIYFCTVSKKMIKCKDKITTNDFHSTHLPPHPFPPSAVTSVTLNIFACHTLMQ